MKTKLTLKRVVMIKAIVTVAFKENLKAELMRAVGAAEKQLEQLQAMAEVNPLGVAAEVQRLNATVADLKQKHDEANALVLETEFVQGPLEGPVEVAIGDNLYKKVGGAEILVRDGIIAEIRGVEEQEAGSTRSVAFSVPEGGPAS